MKLSVLIPPFFIASTLWGCQAVSVSESEPAWAVDDAKADGVTGNITLHRATDWYPTEIDFDCPFDDGCDVLISVCIADFDSSLEPKPTGEELPYFGTVALTSQSGKTDWLYGLGPDKDSGSCPTVLYRDLFDHRGPHHAEIGTDDIDKDFAERLGLTRVSLNVRIDWFPRHSTPCSENGDGNYCEVACGDGLDGDADGLSDCEDADCHGVGQCEVPEPDLPITPLAVCDENQTCTEEVTGSVARLDAHSFTVEVSEGEKRLIVTLDPKDLGDPDLYVDGPAGQRWSSVHLSGKTDEVTVEAPAPGQYVIRVRGWSAADYALTAGVVPGKREDLELEFSGDALARNERKVFEVEVEEGASEFLVTLAQLEGDVTLYASFDRVPDGALGFRCAKVLPRGEDKECAPMDNPDAGTWYIVAEGASDVLSSYRINASVRY